MEATRSVPIPGTVHLVDDQRVSTRQHGNHQRDIILIPQPTNDPNDPLNWSPSRKLNSTTWQMLWTFFTSFCINGLTPAYLLIQQDTGITIGDLNTGNGLMYLFFGFGNLITQPFAVNYGRRPAAFYAAFITSFLVLWASFMNTAGEWYANRILIGIFLSSIECLIELCITDTKFTHERGSHMGFYTWVLFGGAIVVPIPAGFLADAAGWRWINRMLAIICFAIAIGTFFFFEETMFYRPTADEFQETASPPKSSDVEESPPVQRDEKMLESEKEASPELTTTYSAQEGEVYGTSAYKSRLRLWGLRDSRQPNTFRSLFFVPITLLRFPGIVFSGFLVGSVLSWFNILLGTITSVLGNPPYNFSANMVGLSYLACVIGITVGCAVCGWANDNLATFLARRNNGIKEPEHRLWATVVPLILHPAGCILYGVGAAHHIHWVGVCFGMGILSAAIVMNATLAFSYAIDCYKEIAGESLVTIVLIRNIMGFAFAYAITPMVNNLGLQNAFITVAFLGMAVTAISFPMIAFGKRMRKFTAPAYWRLVEKHGIKAH